MARRRRACWFLLGHSYTKEQSTTTEATGMKPMRATGKIVSVDKEPTGVLAEEAKKINRARWERKIAEAAKPKPPVPNRICYAALYEQWKANGGGKLPKCRRCQGTIHWGDEHHDCPGYISQYDDFSDTEQHRAMHEAKTVNEADWNDDQVDRSVEGEGVPRCQIDPDEEDSGCVVEGMSEDEWLMKKFGYVP